MYIFKFQRTLDIRSFIDTLYLRLWNRGANWFFDVIGFRYFKGAVRGKISTYTGCLT
jgi:hypothetical protein